MAKPLPREVVTLQLGHYSNFVGTHLWNLQESSFCYDPNETSAHEINYDCFYREGLTQNGQETYTPRVVLFDLKGSLRNLSQLNSLYQSDLTDTAVTWPNQLSVHRTESEPKNEFQMDIEDEKSTNSISRFAASSSSFQTPNQFAQNTSKRHDPEAVEGQNEIGTNKTDTVTQSEKFYDLGRDVSVWSDFLGTQFHPKTVQLVGEYLHNAEMCPFDVFGYGQSVLRRAAFYDGVEESLHFFVEECDSLQGFQVITELCNGFGGLASELLQDLSDEFGSKSFMTFGVLPSHYDDNTPVKTAHRILNTALSVHHLIKHSSLFAPLSLASEAWYKTGPPVLFPDLIYESGLPYHTSSVLAASLDTVTLPFRLQTPQACRMSDLVGMVTAGGRTMASVATALPIPCGGTVTLGDLLSGEQWTRRPLLTAITPNMGQNSTLISHAAILRGIPLSFVHRSQQRRSVFENSFTQRRPGDFYNTANEMVTTYFQNLYSGAAHLCWSVGQPCMTKPPFPNIFAPSVTMEGLVMGGYTRPCRTNVPQTSVLSTLSTCTGIDNVLSSLSSWAHKVNIQKYHAFLEAGTELATFEEALESIVTLAQRYEMP